MKITKEYLKQVIKEEIAKEVAQVPQQNVGMTKINNILSDLFTNHKQYGFRDQKELASVIAGAVKPYLEA